jgi:hypothetical protein
LPERASDKGSKLLPRGASIVAGKQQPQLFLKSQPFSNPKDILSQIPGASKALSVREIVVSEFIFRG